MPETGRVYPVHDNKFKFGINGLASEDAEMVVPMDLTNFSPVIDGTTEDWFAMDAEGWSKSAVVGKKLSFSFQGKRSVGDPGNDYIAGMALKMGPDAMTKFEWVMVSGATMKFDCVINVTTPGGGDTASLDALEFEAICYGKPEFTAAPAPAVRTAPTKVSAKAQNNAEEPVE